MLTITSTSETTRSIVSAAVATRLPARMPPWKASRANLVLAVLKASTGFVSGN
jgi:hypothetical protein